MTDIFISYASEDVGIAKPLAHALTEQGWSVWWDRKISAGQVFEEVIEEAIDNSKCVVVLWSQASVKSRWVSSEANEGVERRILVPVLLDDSKIPLAFRRFHTADLTQWSGEGDSIQVAELSESIAQVVDKPQRTVVPIGPHPIRIESLAPKDQIPVDVDALVLEQDTALVLSVSKDIRDPGKSIEILIGEIDGSGHSRQGSVLVLKTTPRQLLAIIHDFGNDPSWTEAAVIKTVHRVLELSTERGFKSIVMPLLGTVHGNLSDTRAREILEQAISANKGRSLRTIWLTDSQPDEGRIALPKKASR